MFMLKTEIASEDYKRFWSKFANRQDFIGEFKQIDRLGGIATLKGSYSPILDLYC
jgi:hypothetical protein